MEDWIKKFSTEYITKVRKLMPAYANLVKDMARKTGATFVMEFDPPLEINFKADTPEGFDFKELQLVSPKYKRLGGSDWEAGVRITADFFHIRFVLENLGSVDDTARFDVHELTNTIFTGSTVTDRPDKRLTWQQSAGIADRIVKLTKQVIQKYRVIS